MSQAEGRDKIRESVWSAAYAAAFVSEFNKSLLEERRIGTTLGSFDRSLYARHAEVACAVADEAVAQLEEWATERGGLTWEERKRS